jgi:hypothetical protein
MPETCGTCRHFHRSRDTMGLCKAHPPTVLMVGMMQHPISGQMIPPRTDSFWTQIIDSEMCGEHSPGVAPQRTVNATAEQVEAALARVEYEGSA